jgi:hypothetical protein
VVEAEAMDEREWLTCNNPADMYWVIVRRPEMVRRKAGRRKLRLFGVACCRQLTGLMADSRSLAAVEVAERFADGRVSRKEVSLAAAAAWQAFEDAWQEWLDAPKVGGCGPLVESWGPAAAAALLLSSQAGNFGGAGLCRLPANSDAPDYRAYRKRGLWQVRVMRCIFGNPFRPVTLDAALRTPETLALAQAAYDNRKLPASTLASRGLTVLADALEEADYTDADILGHLRGPGPHVRGCFVLDTLLDKS